MSNITSNHDLGSIQVQIADLLNRFNRLQNRVFSSEIQLKRFTVEMDGDTVACCAEVVECTWYMAEICHFVAAPPYRWNPFRFIRMLKRCIANAHKHYPVLIATVRADNGPMMRGIFRLGLGFKVAGRFHSRISGKPVFLLIKTNEVK